MFALVWTLFIVAAVWFMLLRPQRRRLMLHQVLMESLEVGHRVVTAGGLHGRIQSMDEETVLLEVAPGTTVTLDRRAVTRNLDAGGADGAT